MGLVSNVVFMLLGLYQAAVRAVLSRVPFLEKVYDIVTGLISHMILGMAVGGIGAKGVRHNAQPLILYEYESCPFCAKVRDCIAVLGLDVLVYPCPRETYTQYGYCKDSRFRPTVQKAGGKMMFPYLEDPNTRKVMYDSDAIVAYLLKEYAADATLPLNYRFALTPIGKRVRMMGFVLSRMLFRCLPYHGSLRVPARHPIKPLELWGHQASPFVGMVREAMCSMELPYLYHNIPFGATKQRAIFRERYAEHISKQRKNLNLIMIPLLVDPNTGTTMVESRDILLYLRDKYQVGEAPYETIADYSTKGATASHGKLK